MAKWVSSNDAKQAALPRIIIKIKNFSADVDTETAELTRVTAERVALIESTKRAVSSSI